MSCSYYGQSLHLKPCSKCYGDKERFPEYVPDEAARRVKRKKH